MQSNATISSVDYVLDLPQDMAIKTVKIRSGRIWGILKNLTLFFVDLNQKPKPQVKIFDALNTCLFIYVSDDGAYCFVRLQSNCYYVNANDLKAVKATLLPGSTVKAITFLSNNGGLKPIVFIVTDTYQICYMNFNNFEPNKLNIIAIEISKEKNVNGISMVRFLDGYYGCSIIYQDCVIPYILDSEFVEVRDVQAFRSPLQNTRHANICVENNQFACINDFGKNQILIKFIVDVNSNHPRTDRMLDQKYVYTLPGSTSKFCVFGEFMFQFKSDGKVNIFLYEIPDPVDGFTVENAYDFDYDTNNGHLYAVYPKKVSQIRFGNTNEAKDDHKFIRVDGSDSIRYWLYNRFLERNDEENAARMFVGITSLPLNDILVTTGKSTKMRFYIYKNVLQKLRQVPGITKQKVAIASAIFDLYTQIETGKQNPDIKEYCDYTQKLLNEGLINMATVYHTLDFYGWDSPLVRLSNPYAVFNKLMERNEPVKALSMLPNITDEEQFVDAALRVLSIDKEHVVSLVSRRTELNSTKYVPILMLESSSKLVTKLLKTGRLTSPWIAKLFALFVSKKPKATRIVPFFERYQNSKDGEIAFIVRTLSNAKQYTMLATGLASIQQYTLAAAFAAKGEDPALSFTIIPASVDDETKKRCVFTVLRSLDRPNAEKLAKNLLSVYDGSGIDTTMLLDFLPNDTPISELAGPLGEFTYQKKEFSNVQKKNINDALSGIEKASNLVNSKEDKAVVLTSTEICEKCRKPFFGEKGIVFPCSHLLHLKCAKELIKDISQFNSNHDECCNIDCPICGYLSARLMKEPYKGYTNASGARGSIDPFTTDINLLPKLVNNGTIKRDSFLFNFL